MVKIAGEASASFWSTCILAAVTAAAYLLTATGTSAFRQPIDAGDTVTAPPTGHGGTTTT